MSLLDTEEVTGSIPVSPTTERPGQRLREENPARPSFMIEPVAGAFPEHSFRPERRPAPDRRPVLRVVFARLVRVVERVEDAAAVSVRRMQTSRLVYEHSWPMTRRSPVCDPFGQA
jgi:hypothetical protein